MFSIFDSVPVINDDDVDFPDFEEDYVYIDNDPLNTAFYGLEDMKEKFGLIFVDDDEDNWTIVEDNAKNVACSVVCSVLDIAFSGEEDFKEKFGIEFDAAIGRKSPVTTTAPLSPEVSANDLVTMENK